MINPTLSHFAGLPYAQALARIWSVASSLLSGGSVLAWAGSGADFFVPFLTGAAFFAAFLTAVFFAATGFGFAVAAFFSAHRFFNAATTF